MMALVGDPCLICVTCTITVPSEVDDVHEDLHFLNAGECGWEHNPISGIILREGRELAVLSDVVTGFLVQEMLYFSCICDHLEGKRE